MWVNEGEEGVRVGEEEEEGVRVGERGRGGWMCG